VSVAASVAEGATTSEGRCAGRLVEVAFIGEL
jgi:hypothetical protein